jgi:hypothetical protein
MFRSRITLAVLACLLLTTSTAEAAKRRPPTAVSKLQKATVPALRQAPVKRAPAFLRRWSVPLRRAGFFANPRLARAVVPPGRSQPWYVIPADGAVCLVSDQRGGTCAWDREVRQGKLWLAMIDPVGASPLPAAGAPVPATVVGVAPQGVTAVTASTESGASVTGAVKDGMFGVAATDVTALRLHRTPIAVAIPDFNGPG